VYIENHFQGDHQMAMTTYINHRLVKGEDLNHHGTLYAGRTAEWFVESGFVAASALTHPENILCLKIHGMLFKAPVAKGSVVRFESRICLTGKSKIVAYIQMFTNNTEVLDGFITFINVGLDHKPQPHGISILAETQTEKTLQQRAMDLTQE
jgi:acyl-CoA hydrolase